MLRTVSHLVSRSRRFPARRFRHVPRVSRVAAGIGLLSLFLVGQARASADDDACNKPSCQKQKNNQVDPPKRTKTAGDPVVMYTGDLDLEETDLQIPGRGMDLSFTRSYRSGTAVDTALGKKWDFSWNQSIVLEYRRNPAPLYRGPQKSGETGGTTSPLPTRRRLLLRRRPEDRQILDPGELVGATVGIPGRILLEAAA